MAQTAVEIVRIVAVIALVCAAAAIATPKGRVPLALRGLAKMLSTVPDAPSRRGAVQPTAAFSATQRGRCEHVVSPAKRLLAFVLVLSAILLALI